VIADAGNFPAGTLVALGPGKTSLPGSGDCLPATGLLPCREIEGLHFMAE